MFEGRAQIFRAETKPSIKPHRPHAQCGLTTMSRGLAANVALVPEKMEMKQESLIQGLTAHYREGRIWTLILSPGYPFYAPLTLGKANFLEFHTLDFDIFKLKPH